MQRGCTIYVYTSTLHLVEHSDHWTMVSNGRQMLDNNTEVYAYISSISYNLKIRPFHNSKVNIFQYISKHKYSYSHVRERQKQSFKLSHVKHVLLRVSTIIFLREPG
jgi:hypothetical protein